jgi:hypothetical protein
MQPHISAAQRRKEGTSGRKKPEYTAVNTSALTRAASVARTIISSQKNTNNDEHT